MTKDKLKELKDAERAWDEIERVARAFGNKSSDTPTSGAKEAVLYALGDAEMMSHASFEPDEATWHKLRDILGEAIEQKRATAKVAFEFL